MAINLNKQKRFTRAAVAFWLLLIYVLAMLVWWFIALNTQNRLMTSYRLNLLTHDRIDFPQQVQLIRDDNRRKTAQYLSEGLVFLSVISVGAVFLYFAVMRQIRIQRQQQNFMMAVTHELKTPISVTRLNLETIRKRRLDETQQTKLLDSSLQEINRLNTLTENILVSAQLEGGYYKLSREPLDMGEILLAAFKEFSGRFSQRSWKADVDEDIVLEGDPLLLRILINNLIENAVKYSPAGSPVAVSLHAIQGKGSMQVIDEGPGIPVKERKRIFHQFYRIGNEDTRTTKGTGLGLYLCRKIARDHKMKLEVTAGEPRGSIFTLSFNVPRV